MLFYIFFVLFISGIIVLGYFFPKKEKIVGILALAAITFVGGFRNRIGSDYDSYVIWYEQKIRDYDFEFGFLAVMNVFRWLKLDYTVLFFFFSFLTYLFVYLGVKKLTTHSNLALLFYVLIPSLYLTSFTLVRQAFAIAVAFYAFCFLVNKKYIVFFFLFLISISIHRTAVVPFCILPLVYKYADKINKNHLFVLIVLSFILSRFDLLSIFSIFLKNNRYNYYFSNPITTNIYKIITLNTIGFFILSYYEKLKKAYPYHKYLLTLYFLSLIFVNFFSKYNEMIRIYSYFRIFEIIVVADLIFLEFKQKRVLFFSFFYLIYVATFIYALKIDYNNPNKNIPKFIPYKNLLW